MKSPAVELNSLLLTFSCYISQAWYKKIEIVKKDEKNYADRPTGRFWELENDANQTFYRWPP